MARLRRIECRDVRIGMFVAGFDGPWIDHPFWRSRFLVRTEREAAAIRACGGDTMLIDLDAGLGPIEVTAPTEEAVADEIDHPLEAGPEPDPAPPPRGPTIVRLPRGPELARAAETVRRSRRAVARMFEEARLGRAVRPEQVGLLVDEITESVARDASALIRVTRLKKKHEYTYMHSVAVSALMINLGRTLKLDPSLVRELGIGGLLHDIGKMSVPEAILDKPDALTAPEYALVRDHPRLGHRLLAKSAELSPTVLDICLHHHEKVDGTGYPFGLTADQLSLAARMSAVCDVYDAVTSDRAYKASWSPTDALSRMRDWDGHFDVEMLDAFVRGIGIYPRGTLVRLRSNRLAIVIDGNDADPTCPWVRSFYETVDRSFLPIADFVTSRASGGDLALGLEDGRRWFGSDWDRVFTHLVRNEAPPESLNGHAHAVVRAVGQPIALRA